MFYQKGLTLFSLSVKNTDFVTFYNLQNVGTKFSKKIILTNLFPKPKGYEYSNIKQSVLLVMLTSCLHYARAINYNQDDQALLPLSQVLCENVFFFFLTSNNDFFWKWILKDCIYVQEKKKKIFVTSPVKRENEVSCHGTKCTKRKTKSCCFTLLNLFII